jgi:polyphosphate kinase
MLLITRREATGLRRYAHLSTGNYNPGTARVYTDLSMLTADETLTADVDQIFLHLASQNRLGRLNQALMAPFLLHKALLDKLAAAGEAAARGEEARVTLKMNALTDEALARALAAASQQGVKIDLIVRGACVLPAGVPGFTDNVRVRSVIGRLLEHSRVFHFRVGANEEVWLSSADWMNRNMLRRVELAWPVTDPALRQRVIDECLSAYLQDTRDAWLLQPDGRYVPAGTVGGRGRAHAQSAQSSLMHRYGHKG